MPPSSQHNERPMQQLEAATTQHAALFHGHHHDAAPALVATASSNNSSSSSGVHSGKRRRKQKATYYIRKEEKEQLVKEVQVLESYVAHLQQQRDPGGAHGGRVVAERDELLNALRREACRSQQLSFAVAQSAASGLSHGGHSNPLSTPIRLGRDWTERHRTLIGMRDKKIQNAFEFAQARSQFLDPLKPHHSDERFENTSGDFCCTKFDLTQFEGAKSVKQVYDALLYYHQNIEISVSERLGHITVREDLDSVDQSSSNYRLLSTQCGVNVESNVVMFTEYLERFEPLGGAPCGIFTADFVDHDELNPYTPREKARRDVSVAIVLTPHMRKKTRNREQDGDGEEEELVVVMTQGKFHRLSHAELELSPQTVQDLRDNMCWGPVMIKAVQELLRSKVAFSDP